MFNKKLIRYSLTIIVSITMLFSCTLSAFADDSGAVTPVTSVGTKSIIPAPPVIPAQAGISAEDSVALSSLIIEPEPGADYDGYIVKLDDSKSAQKDIDFEVAEELSEKVIDDNHVLVSEPEDVLEFADLNAVDLIEPNYLVSIAETFPDIDPNDPKYNDISNSQWDLPLIGAPDLWKEELRGSDSGSNAIKIAIIDTGINTTHEDINPANIIFGKNYSGSYNGDTANYVDDVGHGSFVAGIIAAQTNNNKGIAGIADEAELIVLKILNGKGGDISAILAALNDLNDGTAPLPDVINMSVGWQGGSDSVNAVIQSLLDKGVIIVAAVGNDGAISANTTQAQVNQLSYPAAYNGVIGVGATDKTDNIAAYSTKNSTVDVSAPGSEMTSISKGAASAYISGSGTSYASPVIAAVAVAVKDFADDAGSLIDGDHFLSILTDTSLDLGEEGKDTSYGVGRLDCNAITAYLLSYVPPAIATVTFDANGGNTLITTKYRAIGKSVGDLPVAARTDYIFDGWYTAISDGIKISKDTLIEEDVTYYAHWTKINEIDALDSNENKELTTPATPEIATEQTNKYKVKFNSRGGNAILAKTVIHASAVGTLKSPKRSGYKFLGWYTKASGGKKISPSTVVKSNTTYYAHWARKYTVKWNANKGKVKKTSTSIAKGSKVGKLQKPTRSGYKFLGWYTKKSGGTKISKSTKIKGSKTYYAHWKKRK